MIMHSHEALKILIGIIYNYIIKSLVLENYADVAEKYKSILQRAVKTAVT